ncbi:MAG: DmsE family decaheme c-type cytochrome [Usitatibacter sp.]
MAARLGAPLVLLAIGLLPLQAALAIPPEAKYVGEKVCIKCHDVESKHFGHTQHAKVFRQNPKNELEGRVCEACHGPGSLHVPRDDHKIRDNLIGFTREWGTPVEVQNAQCLNCHKGGQRLHWPGSIHDINKIACSDCHNAMARFSARGLLRSPSISETCQTCHGQQRAEFRKRSHMPLPEGKMSCDDCHSPHGSPTRPLLRADTVNDVCYTCHAEKRGPMLWEHAPVRESCLNCHTPHGSNHDKLLVAARPYLCQQCHTSPAAHAGQFYGADRTAQSAQGGGTQSPRSIDRSCQNCHSQVHGSNHPSGARFQR